MISQQINTEKSEIQGMRDIQLVLFDVDGTLLDTREFIYQAFEYTCKQHQCAPFKREELEKVIGQSLEKCYSKFYPGENLAQLCQTHRDFQSRNLNLSVPFSHAVETLKQLKGMGFKIAAVTSRSNRTALKTLELAEMADYFDMIVTGDDVQEHKPHPEGLFKVLKEFNIRPENALMIGDTESDILAGKNAGIITIGVTYGFQGESISNFHPDFLVNDISEVVPLIKSISSQIIF